MKKLVKEIQETLNVWNGKYQIEKVTNHCIYIRSNNDTEIFSGCVINAIQQTINMRKYSFYVEYYNNKVQMVIHK